MNFLDPTTDPIAAQIIKISEAVNATQIEVPIDWLRRAEAAASEEYGSNDAEHDCLIEMIDDITRSIGEPGYSCWRLVISAPGARSDLVDELELPELIEDSTTQTDGMIVATLDDTTLGVAQQVCYELLTELTDRLPRTQLISFDPIN
jgi:hypothetical protein